MAFQKASRHHQLTYLETALKERLQEIGLPVITPYRLFLEMRALYASGRDLKLRKDLPDREDLNLRRQNLLQANVLAPDPDYRFRAYRIRDNNDGSAEDIACIVDPLCCISHLSAMARFGLTDRRPRELHLKGPSDTLRRKLTELRMGEDYGNDLDRLQQDQIVKLRGVNHPKTVRKRRLREHRATYLGRIIEIRDGHSRVTAIGQTFADMLEHPQSCGGMAHVLEAWREHANLYIEEIIGAIERHPTRIVKVRAGYILDEELNVQDNRVQKWTRYAQRGGSRVLDPERVFAPTFSEKWMLSINVR